MDTPSTSGACPADAPDALRWEARGPLPSDAVARVLATTRRPTD